MNIQLDKRLGKIWMQVEQQLKFDLDEIENFRKAAVKAKDFDDLPPSCKDLVLKIEGGAKEKVA
ncbi:hypothetical protein [Synechocystis sp. PCC 7509]|uniref:hypothetical protein n=1 Tax=Synechocystis sp. PCC 7509 TaxID=927677 RepID=UPI0002AC4053|nr:hypothetical protein [Synechocystis sp. PCC 7509]